jgi:hypothetical protein
MIEIRERVWKDIKHPEVFIDGQPLEMGDDVAEFIQVACKKHGVAPGLRGFNEGGYNFVDVCLECCKEVMDFMTRYTSHQGICKVLRKSLLNYGQETRN